MGCAIDKLYNLEFKVAKLLKPQYSMNDLWSWVRNKKPNIEWLKPEELVHWTVGELERLTISMGYYWAKVGGWWLEIERNNARYPFFTYNEVFLSYLKDPITPEEIADLKLYYQMQWHNLRDKY